TRSQNSNPLAGAQEDVPPLARNTRLRFLYMRRSPMMVQSIAATVLLVLAADVAAAAPPAPATPPQLLREPTVSATPICFSYAGDRRIVDRKGGDARRLTTDVGIETSPIFSPDGSLIAFTGEYDGNHDVFVVSAQGGMPRRVTAHPGGDEVVGWTRDGKRVL